MYTGYLRFGGNVIVNNELTRGYAGSLDCPVQWLREPYCPSLNEALGEPWPYSAVPATELPWYDPKLDDESSRFLGVYGIDFSLVQDSTRQVPTVEGITDGGVIGRTRKGMKRFRLRALLIGHGRDAADYGISWLNAAIDPDACGSVSYKCGTADLEWFADCPPARGTVPFQEWQTVATNMLTNPSMESTGAPAVQRTNLHTNPSVEVEPVNFEWDNGAAGTGGTTTSARTPGEGRDGGASFRKTWTVGETSASSSANMRILGDDFGTGSPTVLPNTEYTASVYVKLGGLSSNLRLTMLEMDAGGGFVSTTQGPPNGAAVGEWFRLSVTKTTGAATAKVRFVLQVSGNQQWPLGGTWDVDQFLLEASAGAMPYFDGSTPPDSDFTAAWTGAPNASPSTLTATPVVGTGSQGGARLNSSTQWAASGARSLRMVRSSTATTWTTPVNVLPNVNGTTYEVVGTLRSDADVGSIGVQIDRATGNFRILDVTVNNETKQFRGQYIGNGSGSPRLALYMTSDFAVGESLWLDDVMVSQVSGLAYFDGDTADVGVDSYTWTGTPNASTSTWERLYDRERPQTDEEWQADIDILRRVLRTSAAESGPIVAAEYRRGDFFAYEVEVDFVSETPHILGISHTIPLDPASPSVIQDIVFNLMQTPSAELPGVSIVIATNYSLNPSVETDISQWAEVADGAVITTAMTDPVKSSELAASGTSSIKDTFTASTTATNGWFGVQQSVPLPADVGQRYSISVWASASLQSGTAVLGTIAATAIWQDAASATLRTDAIGAATPAAGGARSAANIDPPANATKVLVRVQLNMTSWSTGAIVRLYTDALAVTNP